MAGLATRHRRPTTPPISTVIAWVVCASPSAWAMVAPPSTHRPSWEQSALRRTYDRAGGILYRPAALTPREFAAVVAEVQSMGLAMREEGTSSFATKRVGAVMPKGSRVHELLGGEEGSLRRLVEGLEAGGEGVDGGDGREGLGGMILAPDIPIEVRVYERAGAGMEWHVDDVLYAPPQVEAILTLENTSDCCTLWRPHDLPLPSATDDDGHLGQQPQQQHCHRQLKEKQQQRYDVRSVQTTPNSALLLRAGGVEHKVSSLTSGTRAILKMAFVREGAAVCEGMEGHASHHHNGGKQKKKGPRRKVRGEDRRKKQR